MKKNRKFIGLALCAFSGAAVLPGCSGGSSSGLISTPPTQPQAIAIKPLRFALQDGRIVTLNLTRTGNVVAGKLLTPPRVTTMRVGTRANEPVVPLSWDGGNYDVSGAFTPPRDIDLTGQITQNGVTVPFRYDGQIPTDTQPGTFSLTAGGQTVTVTLPAFNAQPPAPQRRNGFDGTATGDNGNTGISTIAASGNSQVQRTTGGKTDIVLGQYSFKSAKDEIIIFQTFGTFPNLQFKTYNVAATSDKPVYYFVFTKTGSRYISVSGNVTYIDKVNNLISLKFENVLFREQTTGKTLLVNGTGALEDKR